MKLIQKNLHAVFELYGNGKVGLLKVRKKRLVRQKCRHKPLNVKLKS